MPLESVCLDWTGKTLFVFPVHGYGWQKINTTAPPPYDCTKEIQIPPPFHVHVKEFIYEGNRIEGAFCVIEQSAHEFDGFWMTFFLRADNEFCNFTSEVGAYNIVISPDRPRLITKPGVRLLHPDSVKGEGIPCLRGYAAIALSVQLVENAGFNVASNADQPPTK